MNNETDKSTPSGEMEINTAHLPKYLFICPFYSLLPIGFSFLPLLFLNGNDYKMVPVEKYIFRNTKVFIPLVNIIGRLELYVYFK